MVRGSSRAGTAGISKPPISPTAELVPALQIPNEFGHHLAQFYFPRARTILISPCCRGSRDTRAISLRASPLQPWHMQSFWPSWFFGLPQLELEPEEPETVQVQLVLPEEEQEEQQQNSEQEAEPISETEETAPTDQAEAPRMLRPVYQFGEKDAGPGETEDGNALKGLQTVEAPPLEDPRQERDTPERAVDVLDTPAAGSPPVPVTEDQPQKTAEATETARSLHDDESPVATSAMQARPRGVRAGELCVTELRRQLLGSGPRYWPDLLPTYRLDEGTLLQVRKGAFRSNARWYNLEFRCRIDEAATRVVSFEFEIGAPVPPAEWAGRGLPAS